MRDRSREIARLEWLLEDAGIKLSLVASELNAVSSRAMLSALINGERDPAVLANLAQLRLRPKSPMLVEALTGRFSDHHTYHEQDQSFLYQDPGPDYYIRRDPEHTKRRALQQLASLGYKVTNEAT
jgi:hypothetical protein